MKGSRRQLRGRGHSAVWQLRAYAGKDAAGKHVYVSRTAYGPAAEADRLLAELVAEVGATDHTGPGETFGQLLDRWLANATVLKGLSPTTVREHKRTIEKTIKPALGAIELRQIKARAIEALYAQMLTRGLSPASVRRVHAVIKAALAQAYRWGDVAGNEADKARPPAVPKPVTTIPTPAEVQAMIAEADKDDPDMATWIALAAVTGCRRAEVAGLEWGDVDFDNGLLTIERTKLVVAGEWKIKGTKTGVVKVLALDPFTDGVLRRQRARHEEWAADLGVELADETPVLTYNLERPISPDTASHYVRKIATRAGVDCNLKALRHWAATMMEAEGMAPTTNAHRMGHSNVTTTLTYYSHPLPELDRAAADALGQLLVPT